MGKLGGSSAPKPPDPWETASADSQLGNFNTYGPAGGGQMFGYTGPNGEFIAGPVPKGSQAAVSYTESPWEKAIREALQPASLGLTNQLIADNTGAGLPGPARPQDTSALAGTIYDRNVSLLQPTIDKTNETLINNLQARGMPVGGEGFNEAYGSQQTATQETLSRLAQDATIGAGQEQSRLFALDSSARQQALAEIAGLMGGGYNPPNNAPQPPGGGSDYAGLVGQNYQSQLAQHQQNQATQAQTAGTLGSLAGSLLLKCTEAVKNVTGDLDTRKAAEVIALLPLKGWTYKPEFGDPAYHVGPMAEAFHALSGLGNPQSIHVIDALGIVMGALQNALERIELLERDLYRRQVN
jgi:hypothetical protein